MVGFPLLLIPLALYNIIVFLMPSVSFADPLFSLTLMSGTEWPVTLSDILVALGILLLLLEVIKGARPGSKYLTDHLLSLVIFGAAVAEFLLWPKFGNSTYFLLVLLAMTDFLSGIALRARRPMRVAPKAVPSPVPPQADPAAVEPRVAEPEPAPPAPTAPSGAPAPSTESERLDHPAPGTTQPGGEPSPELQPNSAPSSPETPQQH